MNVTKKIIELNTTIIGPVATEKTHEAINPTTPDISENKTE